MHVDEVDLTLAIERILDLHEDEFQFRLNETEIKLLVSSYMDMMDNSLFEDVVKQLCGGLEDYLYNDYFIFITSIDDFKDLVEDYGIDLFDEIIKDKSLSQEEAFERIIDIISYDPGNAGFVDCNSIHVGRDEDGNIFGFILYR